MRSIFLALFVALLVACPKTPDPKTPTTKSLYDRLGGKDAITAVVDDFVANVAADTRINGFFGGADIPNLKKQLVDQICAATGGPCKYTGKTMKQAHASMGITSEHFDALLEDFGKALDKHKVKAPDKQTLIGVLAPMKTDIVESQSG